jgi:hypothetical protein
MLARQDDITPFSVAVAGKMQQGKAASAAPAQLQACPA